MSLTKEEKRKALLQSASHVLLELGPHKTTLDDIARCAGMAKTSLYYYFRDKNEIIREIMRSDMEQLLDLMSSAAAGQKTAEEKMFAVTKARYLFMTERAQRASRETISEFRSLAGVFEPEREHYLQAHKELIERILRDGVERGELKPLQDLDLVSLIIIASMFGCDHTFAFYGHTDRVLDGMRQMVGIFFAGLRI